MSLGIIKEIRDLDIRVFFFGKNREEWVKKVDLNHINLDETGKSYRYKVCNICFVIKDYYKDFEVNQTDAKGGKTTRPSCRDCRKKIDGVKLLASEKKRMNLIKPTKYFVCPICHKVSIPDVTANLVIDHDHHTGKARSWICDSCNTGLGRFKDNIETMQNAIKYLKDFEESKK